MRRFPTVQSGGQSLTFFLAPYQAPARPFAALAFAWQGDRVLICDIADRGWCVPSGRVETGETSLEACMREADEEAGAVLSHLEYIGCFRIVEGGETRWAESFSAHISRLGDIGRPRESLRRRLVSMAELPAVYYQWNELMEQVFEHSRD